MQGQGIGGDICRFAARFARERQVYFHDVIDDVLKAVKSKTDNFQGAVGVPVHQVVSFSDAWISDKSLERKLVAEVRMSNKVLECKGFL